MTQRVVERVTPQQTTLLVVEDDPDIRSMLQDLFAGEGYTVHVASSGTAALDLLEREQIDAVVLDLILPDMDGYRVCERARQSSAADVPIVMLTALTESRSVIQGLETGADDYLTKPFQPQELNLRVRRLLQRRNETSAAVHAATHLRDMLQLMQRQVDASKHEASIEATLRREFLHNVTTHMRALTGIAEATTRKLAPGADRDAVQQLKSRILGAALVYEVSEALQEDPVEIGGVVRTITTALKAMYRPWKRVTLEMTNQSVTLPLAVATPVAMVVNELITNCFKHAFPDNRFGTIEISYAAPDATFVLDVVDNGVGFDTAAATIGKGRSTVTHLITSFNGSVEWHSDPTGTRVHAVIPLTTSA